MNKLSLLPFRHNRLLSAIGACGLLALTLSAASCNQPQSEPAEESAETKSAPAQAIEKAKAAAQAVEKKQEDAEQSIEEMQGDAQDVTGDVDAGSVP